MSYNYDTDEMVWVGDLDGYINIDAINRANKREAEQDALEVELESLGDIALFSNHSISSRRVHSLGVSPEQWRWMCHHAERSLDQAYAPAEIEAAFLDAVMNMARRYAVARFARLQGLSYSAAITATFSHGIRALLFNYMTGERSLSDPSCRKEIQQTLRVAVSTPNLTAYDRAGLLRHSFHKLAIQSEGANAHLQLNKDGLRDILSLTRLHFLVNECKIRSAADLREVHVRYESTRAAEKMGYYTSQAITGKRILNWRLRSLHPLTFYFPYAVRKSLKRLIVQDATCQAQIERSTAINEIALANCEMELMRRRSMEKAKQSE